MDARNGARHRGADRANVQDGISPSPQARLAGDETRRTAWSSRWNTGWILAGLVAGVTMLGTVAVIDGVFDPLIAAPPVEVEAAPIEQPEPPEPPGWYDGDGQVLPAVLPNVLYPAEDAPEAFHARECVTDDVSLVSHDWDYSSSRTSTVVTATHISSSPCVVKGWPTVRIEQGRRLDVSFEQVSRDEDGDPTSAPRLILEPGHSASAMLTWPRARTEADTNTPQRLFVQVGSARDGREVPLTESPAPFDVVPGTAIELGPWVPARTTSRR